MIRALRVALLGLVLGTAACNGCNGCNGEKNEEVAPAPAPAPAPESLLADAYVISPNPSWSKLQRGVGGAVGILPATLPSIVAMAADLDPRIASELDGGAPMFGSVAGDPAAPAFCIAMKLVDPRRARMILTDGESARYTIREDGGLTHLVAKAPPSAERKPAAAALTSNGYVVVGKLPEDLGKLAAYTTRTLPSRPLPNEGAVVIDVPRSAVSNLLAPKLEGGWSDLKAFLLAQDDRTRREHGGRAPDFGDPKAIVAALDAVVGRRIAVFRDLERVRLAFDVDESAVLVSATLTPAAGDGPAKKWVQAMRVGDAANVLGLPASSVVALSTRDTEEDRASQAGELEKAVASSLGDRLKEPDAKRLHDVLDDWTKGRDETLAISYLGGEPSGTLVTTRARDGEAANRAVRTAIDLTRAAPFKELLRVQDVTTATEDIPGFGKAQIATIAREAKKPAAPPFAVREARDGGATTKSGAAVTTKSGVAWSTESGSVLVAIGDDPLVTLKAGVRPERKLRDDPLVARFAANIGDTASTIFVGQPLRLDAKRADQAAAPIAIAVTRKGGDAVLRMDVSDALLRELSRNFLGF